MLVRPSEVDVTICDGAEMLETRRCHMVRLRDGRPAATWRGLAFPLLPDNRIDAAGKAWPIADTIPCAPPGPAFAVIDGASEAYVLVTGGFIEAETGAASLRQAGITVLRTGRYYGEAVADLAADWFIRIVRPPDTADLAQRLEPILAAHAVRPDDTGEADTRTRLLTAELLAARDRAAAMQQEIARLCAMVASTAPEAQRQAAALQEALLEAQRLREAAEQAKSQLQAAMAAPAPAPPRPLPSGRMADEARDVLAGLLPNIRMLRDSVNVITAEFASRRGVWRALGQLGAGGIPRDWKKIQGAPGWWECHLVNGRDNTGRLYVRKAGGSAWDVLISHKAEQVRDIAWLERQ
jgi:hypothetical protein